MTRGIDPGKEMREDVELGSVYTSVVCIGRRRIMRLWQLLLRGTSIVAPGLLRVRVAKLAHEGHKCKIGSLVKFGGREWTGTMRSFVEFFIAIHFRFLEVATVMCKKSTKVIEAFAPMFASFGFSFSLRSDNGPSLYLKSLKPFYVQMVLDPRERISWKLPTLIWALPRKLRYRSRKACSEVVPDCKTASALHRFFSDV